MQDVGETYGSIQRGDPCSFGEVYRSDGRIVADDLTVLADDKGYFPKYTPAVVVRQPVHDQAPVVGDIMAPVMAALDDDTLRGLCGQVSVQRRDPVDVARTWLVTHGFPV